MVGVAIKGLPREQLFIQTKMPWDRAPFPDKPSRTIDRYRRELGIEYIDSLLLHCATEAHVAHRPAPDDGRVRRRRRQKGIIRVKGVSCHGLPALTAATHADWVDVHLARINRRGTTWTAWTAPGSEPGNQPTRR